MLFYTQLKRIAALAPIKYARNGIKTMITHREQATGTENIAAAMWLTRLVHFAATDHYVATQDSFHRGLTEGADHAVIIF